MKTMKQWLNSLRGWSLKVANTKKGTITLFILAFADASFLPVPIMTFSLVLALLNSSKAYHYALINTLGTLAGSLAGYTIGHLAWINIHGEFTFQITPRLFVTII
jgi:membrane protein YqaA with SNARE-associated domain